MASKPTAQGAPIVAAFVFGAVVGMAVTSLTFAMAATDALRAHVRDEHFMDRIDDDSIQEPACGVIYRVEGEERVPVATIGSCGPSNSTEPYNPKVECLECA